MRIVTWTIRLVLFLFLVALAAKNADPVTVRFYFDVALKAPLVVVMLCAFLAGALFGVLALTGTVLRLRREASALRRAAARAPEAAREAGAEPPPVPPPPL